jgi:hypothetical protein
MRQIVHKCFWAWEFEEEEKWLNSMAQKGKALVSARFLTYEFEDSAPGEYAVRLEMLEHSPNTPEGQQYIEFIESTGAEYIGKVMKWVYFRKKKADGEFTLHGDNATRIKHVKNILRLLLPLGIMNIGAGMYNLCIGIAWNSSINCICAGLSAAVSALLGYGYYKLNEKKKQLEREAQLFE